MPPLSGVIALDRVLVRASDDVALARPQLHHPVVVVVVAVAVVGCFLAPSYFMFLPTSSEKSVQIADNGGLFGNVQK